MKSNTAKNLKNSSQTKKEEEILIRKQIGQNLKLARSNVDMTQEKLAKKTGLSVRYISQLERGYAFGSSSTIVSLCNSLNISVDFLFGNFITNNKSHTSEFSNDDFINYYLKLNHSNKNLLKLIAKQLVELQKKDNE